IVSTYFLSGHVYAMNANEAILEVVQPTRRRGYSKEFKEKVIRAAMPWKRILTRHVGPSAGVRSARR
ncbi:hypothetical protein SB753_35770, partial [Paraburkholderia sp. SIMBA_053]